MASTMLFVALPRRSRFRNVSANRVADEGTQALIAGEEEEFVFLIGPPATPPNCSNRGWRLITLQRGGFALGTQIPLVGAGLKMCARPRSPCAESIRRAVKSVGPRSDSYVHYGAGLPAITLPWDFPRG